MDELARMNKGFMRKDGKFFLPITHESLVIDNDGINISKKYLTKDGLVGYATEDYVSDAILQAQLGGAEVDLSKFATVEQLNMKADADHNHDDVYVQAEDGKSLVDDSEIQRLATLVNYDDTEIRNILITKANTNHNHDEIYATKAAEHTHINKAVIDGITLAMINEWTNKSDFSGDYNDLTNKPEIPSIEGLATEEFVDARIEQAQLGGEVDLSGYATKEDLEGKADKNHTHSEYLTSIPDEYVTDAELDLKVDKVEGKSLVDDTEIARLSAIESYEVVPTDELLAMCNEIQNS